MHPLKSLSYLTLLLIPVAATCLHICPAFSEWPQSSASGLLTVDLSAVQLSAHMVHLISQLSQYMTQLSHYMTQSFLAQHPTVLCTQ